MGYGVQKQNILTFLSIFATYLVSHDSQQHLNVADSIKTLLDYYEQNEI